MLNAIKVLLFELVAVTYLLLEEAGKMEVFDLRNLINHNSALLSILIISPVIVFALDLAFKKDYRSNNVNSQDIGDIPGKSSLRDKYRSDDEKINLHAHALSDTQPSINLGEKKQKPKLSTQKPKKGPPGPRNPVKYTGQKKVGFA